MIISFCGIIVLFGGTTGVFLLETFCSIYGDGVSFDSSFCSVGELLVGSWKMLITHITRKIKPPNMAYLM